MRILTVVGVVAASCAIAFVPAAPTAAAALAEYPNKQVVVAVPQADWD